MISSRESVEIGPTDVENGANEHTRSAAESVIPFKGQDAMKMPTKMVIATGCPYSEWKKTLPVLEQAGFQIANKTFSRWHDELFKSVGLMDPLKASGLWQMGSEIVGGIPLMPEKEVPPKLMADSRTLWLLDFWAAKMPRAKFILFYSRVEAALARACREGIDPQQRLNEWQTVSNQLLTFHRHNRKRTLLLDADAAVRNPQALIEAFERFDVKLEHLTQESTPATYSIEQMLAHKLVSLIPEIQSLQADMAASSYPLEEVPIQEPEPLDLILDHWHRINNGRKLTRKLNETGNKYHKIKRSEKRLKASYKRLQKQFESVGKIREEQAKQVSNYQLQLQKAVHENKKLTTEKKDSEKENGLLLMQLHQVQEELESTFFQKQTLEKQKEDKESRCNNLRENVKQLTKDRDEQAKLRTEYKVKLEAAQQSSQKLESDKNEAQKENELLLLQLHQVQEELEDYLLRNQKLKQSHERLETAHQELVEGKKTLSEELNQLNERLALKKLEIEKQHQRVTSLKKSFSWKITAPMRAIANAFNPLTKEQKKLKKEIELIKGSGYFDEAYYLSENEDVVKEWDDPVKHFIQYGATEMRNPSSNFNVKRYLEINPDVSDSGINPLLHYIKFGLKEGRVVSDEK